MSETETVSELNDVRERLKALNHRLSFAEAHLRFYADPRNYGVTFRLVDQTTFQNMLADDFSMADNDPKTVIAGNRARTYFKMYGEQ